jgi:hypothetical protein
MYCIYVIVFIVYFKIGEFYISDDITDIIFNSNRKFLFIRHAVLVVLKYQICTNCSLIYLVLTLKKL